MSNTDTRRPRRSFGKIHRERSGKFQASYIGPIRQAEQQTKIRKGKWDPGPENAKPSSLTLAAYADPWLADRDLKPRTCALYRNLLDRRILPALGDRPLAGLTAADIRSWHCRQASDMPTARAHAYTLLRSILGSAVLDGSLRLASQVGEPRGNESKCPGDMLRAGGKQSPSREE